MSDTTMMQAENICRNYGKQRALNNISFVASKGEVTGFLGPNGAGKSTLMQIISGVLAATSGAVSIAGFNILKQPASARSALGYLPDKPPLYIDCNIDTYLLYCAQIRNVPRDLQENRVEIVKQICGLEGKGKQLIQNLSKGYQQRAGLAQAIIHSPEVLILDEPSSGLDPNQTVEMRKMILELKKDHCIIFSTHILSEAFQLCDRIIIINSGDKVLEEPISFFNDQNALEEIYVNETKVLQPHTTANINDHEYS